MFQHPDSHETTMTHQVHETPNANSFLVYAIEIASLQTCESQVC